MPVGAGRRYDVPLWAWWLRRAGGSDGSLTGGFGPGRVGDAQAVACSVHRKTLSPFARIACGVRSAARVAPREGFEPPTL